MATNYNYDTSVVCTYHTPEVFTTEEENEIDITTKHFIRNAIYRQELLNIFGFEECDEALSKAVVNLCDTINKNSFINECAIKLAGEQHLYLGLQLLFSYDFLYITHGCICDLFKTGAIKETHQTILTTAINGALRRLR